MLFSTKTPSGNARGLRISMLMLLSGIMLSACSPMARQLSCDDSLKTTFQPDDLTEVLLVKEFKKGEPLKLPGAAESDTPPPQAVNDLCVVKLNVGPGNPGPADAASTSAGIGIEIWLPTPANWNERIHVLGGGGWAGGLHSSLTELVGIQNDSTGAMHLIAGVEGAVTAQTDTGHTVTNGSFAMNPDGTINTVLWNDFSHRAIHEMAVKTKALTKAYYGRAANYAYWDGFSTGGRQGHKLAQLYPDDFDGILAGAGAINWKNFITNELYPMIVIEKELGGKLLTPAQLALLGNAAIAACDDVGGVDLGYILDLDGCHYDPTQDKAVLCVADGGSNDTPDCVSPTQANVVNRIWYGQTRDGSVPAPADDHGYGSTLDENQIWFGLTRGSNLGLLTGASFFGPAPFPISTDMVALELQEPAYTNAGFTNSTGNGTDAWKELTYEQLADATEQGVSLQASFGEINTDSPDLTAFQQEGGKLLAFHGLSDELIAPQGSIHYYERVVDSMGSIETVQDFYRLYLIPGMGHWYANGTTNPNANPPLPGAPGESASQLYTVLVDWVEKGIVPERIDITSRVTEQHPTASSRPICVYPQAATYTSGDPIQASSYECTNP